MPRVPFVVALCAAGAALADDTHYQDFVVGGRAAALAGAYAAISDDPSGLYYNPAGLTDVSRLSLSVSTSLYGIERGQVGSAQSTQGVNLLKLSFAELNMIPGEAGGVKTFDQHPQRGAGAAWAFVVEVPSFRNLQVHSIDDSPTQQGEYRRRLFDRTLWLGTGGAVRADHQWSFGLAAFYLLRTFEESEESFTAWPATTPGGPIAFAERKVSLGVRNGSLLGILGVKYRAGPFWRFGLALGTPTLALHGGGEATFLRSEARPDVTVPGGFRTDLVRFPVQGAEATVASSIKSTSSLGGFARFGMAYSLPKTYTWSADAIVHLPTQYALVRTSDARLRGLLNEFSIDRPVKRNLVVNFNTGFEYLVMKEISLAGGVFTDFSSAPDVEEQAESAATVRPLPKVHLVGGTFTVGYFGDHSLTRLGVSFSTSVGGIDSIRSLSDITDAPQRIRVDVSQSFLYVFLASTFRY